ncbi:MAG TPA: hypothetical protein VFA49_11230, partial [Chloroflexota bacterium]|nr:hypothetical protein [Chloroflexota bacterium]
MLIRRLQRQSAGKGFARVGGKRGQVLLSLCAAPSAGEGQDELEPGLGLGGGRQAGLAEGLAPAVGCTSGVA